MGLKLVLGSLTTCPCPWCERPLEMRVEVRLSEEVELEGKEVDARVEVLKQLEFAEEGKGRGGGGSSSSGY